MEAEQQKITNGLVALGGGHTEQMDEAVAALAMVIRNALTRLPAEISRTTNYYRGQHGGSAPRRVLLAGGGANLPYTLEFFQEKLNLPVEYFNPLRNVTLGKGVDTALVQREGHLMGELIGLGLRGIGKSVINIDLVPGVVEQSRAADRRKPFLIGASAVLLSGMAIWVVFQTLAAASAKENARMMDEQRESLSPIKGEIAQLLSSEEQLRKIASKYTDAEADHAFWMDLLAELRGAFASDAVWITDLEPLLDYDPLATGTQADGKPASATRAGKSVVKPEFLNTAFGATSLNEIQVEKTSQPPGSDAAAGIKANAVRIKGFWRETPKQQDVVSEILKNLRDKSTRFVFKVKDSQGAEVTLSDDRVLDITVAGKPGELGLPFEIALPLARSVGVQ